MKHAMKDISLIIKSFYSLIGVLVKITIFVKTTIS